MKSSKPLPLLVLPGSSLQTSRWSLVSAPATVRGLEDDKSVDRVQVVVQMARRIVAEKPVSNGTVESKPKVEQISVTDQVPNLQKITRIAAEKSDADSKTQPQPNAEGIYASDRAHDPNWARRFVIEKSAGIAVYEPGERTGDISASDQVHELQAAVDVLRARPATQSVGRLDVHRPGRSAKIFHVLARILTFGCYGGTHSRLESEGFSKSGHA